MYPPSGGINLNRNQPPVSPTTLFGNPATFTAAATQQAKDYDTIMQQYKDLAAKFSQNPLTTKPVSFSPIAPQTTTYAQSPDVTSSLASLKGLTDTGGYSAKDIQDIRERDISPIRSIYAQGEQELERNRALSGGYSPSFNATAAQMARDESQKISDVTTAANAGIAQNVAANKIAAAPSYASAAASANAAKTAVDEQNANIINQINQANQQLSTQIGEFNQGMDLQTQLANRGNILNTIGGQASLYGTTPALTSTFGNQVSQATQLGQGQQNINDRKIQLAGGIASGSWGR